MSLSLVSVMGSYVSAAQSSLLCDSNFLVPFLSKPVVTEVDRRKWLQLMGPSK